MQRLLTGSAYRWLGAHDLRAGRSGSTWSRCWHPAPDRPACSTCGTSRERRGAGPYPRRGACSASTATSWRSRRTCTRAWWRSPSSGWPTRRWGRPGTGPGRRCSTAACRGPPCGSRSGCLRPGCPSGARRSTCRSRSRSPSPRARSPPDAVADLVFVGELGLDGRIRPVRGALVAALAARDAGVGALVVPAGNLREAELVPGLDVAGVPHPGRPRRPAARRPAAGGGAGRAARRPSRRRTGCAASRAGPARRARPAGGAGRAGAGRRGRPPRRDVRAARDRARPCWPSGCPGLLPAAGRAGRARGDSGALGGGDAERGRA